MEEDYHRKSKYSPFILHCLVSCSCSISLGPCLCSQYSEDVAARQLSLGERIKMTFGSEPQWSYNKNKKKKEKRCDVSLSGAITVGIIAPLVGLNLLVWAPTDSWDRILVGYVSPTLTSVFSHGSLIWTVSSSSLQEYSIGKVYHMCLTTSKFNAFK